MSFIGELKQKSGLVGLRSHFVQAWNKTVYFKPISPAETNKVVAQGTAGEANAAMWVRYVITKSLDQNSVRLFLNDDFQALMDMPYQAEIEELYNKMKMVVTVDDAEQDFTKTPA